MWSSFVPARTRVLIESLVTTGAALAGVLPLGAIAQTLIQRTITIDGNLADWTTAPNILTNAAQSSTDAVGAGDLDAPVQSTGRDLAGFAYTWDDTSLYLQVTRAGSVSNTTDWWFYIDNDANGSMQSGENVLRVSWQGSNRSTTRSLCTYTAVAPGGDPLVSPSTGQADGYDMPGTVGACTTLLPNLTGGDNTGLRMETSLPWSALGFSGPTGLGFHVASSNGANLPNQIDDNMDGPGGSSFLLFTDNRMEKTASVAQIASGQSFTYSLTVRNLSATASANITVVDVLPTGVTYASHSAPVGSTATYAAGTRTLSWYVPSIAPASSATLTLGVVAGPAGADTLVVNEADITSRDVNATNNTASAAVDVIAAAYRITKTVATVADPIGGTSNPRSIPGAVSEYTITATNLGGLSDADSLRIVDPVPANTRAYVADVGAPGSGPAAFLDGAPASGLTYSYGGLASLADSLEFSADGGLSWSYVPTPGTGGCDANVTHVRVRPTGVFASGLGVVPAPSFSVKLRVCID
jgi:uncharacterized repeat protein (TIGR01451 family)